MPYGDPPNSTCSIINYTFSTTGGYTCPRCGVMTPYGTTHSCGSQLPLFDIPSVEVSSMASPWDDQTINQQLQRIADAVEKLVEQGHNRCEEVRRSDNKRSASETSIEEGNRGGTIAFGVHEDLKELFATLFENE